MSFKVNLGDCSRLNREQMADLYRVADAVLKAHVADRQAAQLEELAAEIRRAAHNSSGERNGA